jgi:hypothetical protein
MSDRQVKSIGSGVAAPTTETVAAFTQPIINPLTLPVLVRGDMPLVGAASVTAITLRIRRGNGITGAILATGAFTVTGAQTVPGNLSVIDVAYDNTGYSLTIQATGAAGTCGPGHLETQAGVPG